MKQLLIAFVCFAFVGCNRKSENKSPAKSTSVDMNKTIQEVTIDSCQYIIFIGFYKGGITHKGNCNNPIHSKH